VQIWQQRQSIQLQSHLTSSLNLLGGPCEGQSKNWDMPLCVACARYSLVKGERIVRFALSTETLREPPLNTTLVGTQHAELFVLAAGEYVPN
jgi:hypothetical protein